ncbi:protein kinase domain-containing protein [Paraglaciecola aestuariivivens]
MHKQDFASPLALFQQLFSIDENNMLNCLSDYAAEGSELYLATKALIDAHYQNQDGTLINGLIHHTANALVDDEAIHKLLTQQVGVYKLTQKLGQGGMGAVYLGERNDGKIQQQVAIKFVYPSIVALAGEDFLHKEAQHLANLNHTNIAKMYTVGMHNHTMPYMVMEYVNGIPIDKYCEQKKMSLAARMRLFQKVCSAVHAAHQNMIIHADLKPSNILVDTLGEVKLMDFGIARRLENLTQSSGQPAPTKPSIQAASYQYASPEHLSGKQLTVESDIYSAAKILDTLTQDLLTLNTTQGSWYQQTIQSCLATQPNKRIASFDVLAKGLNKIEHLQAPEWVSPTAWQKLNSFVLRNTKLTVASSLFVLVIVVFMLKLMAQNQALIEQNASNQKVIAFLSQLFGKEAPSNNTESVFGLLSQDQHQALATDSIEQLSSQYNQVFSPYIFSNHSAKVGELITLPLTLKNSLAINYTIVLKGPGKITENNEYQHSFNQVGIHNVKIVAKLAQQNEVLNLTFIVRDDKHMPFRFADISPQDNDYADLHYLALKGIVIGRPGENPAERIFSPNQPIKQAEALKLIMMAAHNRQIIQLKKTSHNYPNLVIINAKQGVEDFSWAATFLEAAYNLGIVTNKANFDPSLPASKVWLAQVLTHTLQLLDPSSLLDNQAIDFSDAHAFSYPSDLHNAKTAAFYNLLGDNQQAFEPQKILSRREVARIAAKIMRLPVIKNSAGQFKQKALAQLPAGTAQAFPDLQTPSYQRIGDTIVALDKNAPSLTSIELKQDANNAFVLILTNTENQVKHAISLPNNIL